MNNFAETCSWCGAEIPDELRLTEEEIKEIDKEHAEAREALEEKREENEKRKMERERNSLISEVVGHLIQQWVGFFKLFFK